MRSSDDKENERREEESAGKVLGDMDFVHLS